MEKIRTKLIHEGDHVAEVEVVIEQSDGPWAPYVSPDEVMKLNAVRLALRNNDIEAAAKYGKVYRVSLVAG
jgi:hypothetical protein